MDEYSLLVYPVVLGSGKQLFPDGLRVHNSAPGRRGATVPVRRGADALRTRITGLLPPNPFHVTGFGGTPSLFRRGQ